MHPVGDNGKLQFDRVVPCMCSRDRVLKERYERKFRYCKLPAGMTGWTLEHFDSSGPLKEAYEASRQIAEEEGETKILTLVGPVDTGKSHLAAAICHRWLDRGKPARFVLVPQMLDELRAGYNREGEYYRLLNLLMNVPLLALDDLGAEKPTGWAAEKLMQLIDHRYSNDMYLVVTSNLPPTELPGETGIRICSRLLRGRFSKVITIDAPEYRLREGGKQWQK